MQLGRCLASPNRLTPRRPLTPTLLVCGIPNIITCSLDDSARRCQPVQPDLFLNLPLKRTINSAVPTFTGIKWPSRPSLRIRNFRAKHYSLMCGTLYIVGGERIKKRYVHAGGISLGGRGGRRFLSAMIYVPHRDRWFCFY